MRRECGLELSGLDPTSRSDKSRRVGSSGPDQVWSRDGFVVEQTHAREAQSVRQLASFPSPPISQVCGVAGVYGVFLGCEWSLQSTSSCSTCCHLLLCG